MIRRLISLALLVWAIGFVGFMLSVPDEAPVGKTDAIVVLTGSKGRIERGLAALQKGMAGRMLISGVDSSVRPREIAHLLGAPAAIFACCVDLGKRATDTIANADEAAAWIKVHNYHSVRLVTNDWHMMRARFEFERALPSSVHIETDVVESSPSLWLLAKEYSKYLLRRIAAPFVV